MEKTAGGERVGVRRVAEEPPGRAVAGRLQHQTSSQPCALRASPTTLLPGPRPLPLTRLVGKHNARGARNVHEAVGQGRHPRGHHLACYS